MMNRFAKKCFIGSATFHGLLLVVFLFGSAFMSKDNLLKDMGPVVTIENVKVTDGPTTGGGNPNGNPNPPPPAPAPVQPAPTAPEPPKPEVIKPTPRPEVPKPEVVKVKEAPKLAEKDQGDLPVLVTKKTTPKDTQTKPSLTSKLITRNDETLQAQRADAEKRRRDEVARANAEAARVKAERQRLTDAVNGIVGGTGKTLGKSTVVEPIGPGGAAFVNYGSLVGEIYKRAVYASQPQSDDDAQAHIRVVVARDGTVRSSEWVRRTGSSVLDKAVDRAMNSVRSLPAFPSDAKDSERTFNIKIAFDATKVSA